MLAAVERRFFRLSDVTRRIEAYLRPALGRGFWLKAELSSGRERNGTFFCELVETGARGEVVAQLPCRIWSADLARMRRAFAQAGLDLMLGDGTLVGVRCELQFHPRHGLSLRATDMDPAVALGELELRRRRILEALAREGLLRRNAERPLALLPNRIALITSRDSAACRDVVETLRASGYGFRVYLADALVQGPEAEARVLAALDACVRLPVELVLLVRGGGSKTDLAALDSEPIARRIAACAVPVWTGIGHESDRGVLDEVAARSFKTPTAAAEELVRRFAGVEDGIRRAAQRLRGVWSLRLRGATEHLRRAATGLRQGSRKLLEVQRARLGGAARAAHAQVGGRVARERTHLGAARLQMRARVQGRLRAEARRWVEARARLARAARRALQELRRALEGRRARLRPQRVLRRLEAERQALARRGQLLRAADPRTALRRGFSLTYGSSGLLLRSVDDLRPGQSVLTRLVDGQFESTVDKLAEDDDG
jgi:exodeoxyribonuclease VII large subunit